MVGYEKAPDLRGLGVTVSRMPGVLEPLTLPNSWHER